MSLLVHSVVSHHQRMPHVCYNCSGMKDEYRVCIRGALKYHACMTPSIVQSIYAKKHSKKGRFLFAKPDSVRCDVSPRHVYVTTVHS